MGPLIEPAWIHVSDLTADGRSEHASLAVGIPGDVGRHVTYGPARQERRLGHLVVGEKSQGGDHRAVRSHCAGEVAVQIVHRVLTVDGA